MWELVMNKLHHQFDMVKARLRTAPFPVPPRKPMRARFSCTISRSPRPLACFMTPWERGCGGRCAVMGTWSTNGSGYLCKVVSVAYNHPTCNFCKGSWQNTPFGGEFLLVKFFVKKKMRKGSWGSFLLSRAGNLKIMQGKKNIYQRKLMKCVS